MMELPNTWGAPLWLIPAIAISAVGYLAAFSVALVAGIAIMFIGFLRAGRPAPVSVPSSAGSS